MSRIGIVNFNSAPGQIGGGQVPAVAFYNWCKIHQADAVMMEGPGFERCDWYFLVTPGSFKGSASYKFQPDAPFAVMVHAEMDKDLYDDFSYYINHNLCRLVVTIFEPRYWKGVVNKPMLHWHPCTLPEYLIKPGHKFDNANRSGMISASRISKWKGLDYLATFSMLKEFRDKVDHRIDVYGDANKYVPIDGDYNVFGRHNVYDHSGTVKLFSQYKYFWDAIWHEDLTDSYHRLNLSAFEGIYCGCIPFVRSPYTAPWALKFAVDVRGGFPEDFYSRQERMLEVMLESPASYKAVSAQFERIIDFMES